MMTAGADIAENVLELARRRGFIWHSYEIYGGVAGFYDYGPLGTLLKRNIENAFRNLYVIDEGFYEIETPNISPKEVFAASHHLECFADEVVRCERCGSFFKRDDISKCECGGTLVFAGSFNLMFRTHIGVQTTAAGSRGEAYLRPETAQGIFVDFPRLLKFNRDKLPFGIIQIGKAFRNEISPRQSLIRLREFTLAEAEIFVEPSQKNCHPRFDEVRDRMLRLLPASSSDNEVSEKSHSASTSSESASATNTAQSSTAEDSSAEEISISVGEAVEKGIISHQYLGYYIAKTHEFLTSIGIPAHRLRFRQHRKDEMAHYASDCWDAEFLSMKYGWIEIVGIADRGDYDLSAHASHSNQNMSVYIQTSDTAKKTRKKVIPHVIEPSYGIDRIIYAVLECAYHEENVGKDIRRVLKLKKHIAPITAAVLPLLNREELKNKAKEVFNILRSNNIFAVYDESGSIGRRYRRQDEIGTPFCITIDYETLENNTVTVRYRDTMDQIRIHIDEILNFLRRAAVGDECACERDEMND